MSPQLLCIEPTQGQSSGVLTAVHHLRRVLVDGKKPTLLCSNASSGQSNRQTSKLNLSYRVEIAARWLYLHRPSSLPSRCLEDYTGWCCCTLTSGSRGEISGEQPRRRRHTIRQGAALACLHNTRSRSAAHTRTAVEATWFDGSLHRGYSSSRTLERVHRATGPGHSLHCCAPRYCTGFLDTASLILLRPTNQLHSKTFEQQARSTLLSSHHDSLESALCPLPLWRVPEALHAVPDPSPAQTKGKRAADITHDAVRARVPVRHTKPSLPSTTTVSVACYTDVSPCATLALPLAEREQDTTFACVRCWCARSSGLCVVGCTRLSSRKPLRSTKSSPVDSFVVLFLSVEIREKSR